MIKLYGCGSPNVFKVQLMLAELGLEYEFVKLPLYGPALSEPRFRALNPNGKLPVLVDDDTPVFESGAILLHLAEKHGRFLPAEGAVRDRTLQWLMWQMAGVGPMFGQALHFLYIAPDGNEYAKGRYTHEAERLYDVAETRLSEAEWFAGDDYTIADIAIYPWLGRYAPTLGIDLSGRPGVMGWKEKIESRPAFKAAEPGWKALFKEGLVEQANASKEDLDRFFGR